MKFPLILVSILIIYSCGTKKATISNESRIISAYQSGNYQLALELFEQNEPGKSTHEPDSNIVEIAGRSAFVTGRWDKAHVYLSRVSNLSSSGEILGMLGTVYMKLGEGEMELLHWNKYLPRLENGSYHQTAATRIFQLQVDKKDFKAARQAWENIPDQTDPASRLQYVTVLENLELPGEALQFNLEILKDYPGFEPAISWKARYYYEKAENLYQHEMAKYNRQRDYVSYAYLRRELKRASAYFRTARDLFITLHQGNPDHVNYMKYLKNCYLRLEMRAEAAKIDQLLKNHLKEE